MHTHILYGCPFFLLIPDRNLRGPCRQVGDAPAVWSVDEVGAGAGAGVEAVVPKGLTTYALCTIRDVAAICVEKSAMPSSSTDSSSAVLARMLIISESRLSLVRIETCNFQFSVVIFYP